MFWYGLLQLFTDYFRDYDSYWFGVGTGQYFNLLMAMVGLGLIFGLRGKSQKRAVSVEISEKKVARCGLREFCSMLLLLSAFLFRAELHKGF